MRFHVFALLVAVGVLGGIIFYQPTTFTPADVSAAGEAVTGSLTFSMSAFATYSEQIGLTDGTDSLTIKLVNWGGSFSSCTVGSAPNCTEYELDIGGGNSGYLVVAAAITTIINSSTLHAVDIVAVDAGGGVVNLSGNIGAQDITLTGVGGFINSISNGVVTLSGYGGSNEVLGITDGVDTLDVTMVNWGGGWDSCTVGSAPNCTAYSLDVGGGHDDNISVATSLVNLINSTTLHSVSITAIDGGDGSFSYSGPGTAITDETSYFVSAVNFTTGNSAPALGTPTVGTSGDGTGMMSILTSVSDADADSVSLEVKYLAGSTCTYSGATAATVSSTASGMTSGALSVNNTNQYQISGIATASQDFITAYWDSATDVSTGNGTYCVFVTPYDGTTAGTTVSTTVTVDNVVPSTPGSLTLNSRGITTANIAFPSVTSTDTNFSSYQIYYKAGSSGVTRSDSVIADSNLFSSTFSGATSTTISGLTASTTYVANIWATDTNGNVAVASTELSFTTRAAATATRFSTSTGSTNLSTVSDITTVENLTLASTTAEGTTTTIVWTGNVNAEGEDYDTNVVLGDRFVSINAAALDSSIDNPATVTFTGVDCSNYEIYYAANHYTTRANVISNGQLCSASTNPACAVVSCTNSTLVFTVPHFDAFGINEPVAEVDNSIPVTSGGSGGGSGYQLLQDSTSKANSLSEQNPDVRIFSINNGETQTTKRSVTLTFGVSNYSHVAISEDATFADASIESFSETKKFTLSEGLGEKTIYVRLSGEGLSPVESVQRIILATEATKVKIVQPVINEKPVSETNCPLEKELPYKSIKTNRVVYVSKECTQTPFVTREKYFSYFLSFDSIRLVEESTLDLIPNDALGFLPFGPLYAPEENSLVKSVFNPKVYLVKLGKKYPIASEQVFEKLGFLWNRVIDVVTERLDNWSTGEELSE